MKLLQATHFMWYRFGKASVNEEIRKVLELSLVKHPHWHNFVKMNEYKLIFFYKNLIMLIIFRFSVCLCTLSILTHPLSLIYFYGFKILDKRGYLSVFWFIFWCITQEHNVRQQNDEGSKKIFCYWLLMKNVIFDFFYTIFDFPFATASAVFFSSLVFHVSWKKCKNCNFLIHNTRLFQ